MSNNTSVHERLPHAPHTHDGEAEAEDSAGSAGSKRKRVVLSIHDKQTVLARLDAGEQPATLARMFGISRQQVSDIKKNRERILAFCVDARHANSLRRKTLAPSSEYHPGVEQALYRWLVRQRLLRRAVASDAFAAKASELFVQFANDAPGVSFKTVANWLRHFKRAHGLKTLSDEELAKLPERFVSAMDMALPTAAAGGGGGGGGCVTADTCPAAAVAGPAASTGLSTSVVSSTAQPMPISVDDYITSMGGVMALHAAVNPLQQQQHYVQHHHQHPRPHHSTGSGAEARHPLVSAATTIQEIESQLAFFEREMAAKLDYLDTRIEKLCYLVLPSRFA
ncbi:hypothetical protein PybrP1_010897 [[Pythium] brassicae (nom. inval.)]|nr:hypothetical protein PybrP1_010897 [[Pythium] brassicae (nom. inval.)]